MSILTRLANARSARLKRKAERGYKKGDKLYTKEFGKITVSKVNENGEITEVIRNKKDEPIRITEDDALTIYSFIKFIIELIKKIF